MNKLTEKLLQPVSADAPCGPDLSSDARFDELEALLKGKPEVEIGSIQKPAEPPDWLELRNKAANFLEHSKHLRVAVVLCCSSLKTEGLTGFRDGLLLIRGFLEQYWPTVYPLLDATDNNDPTQRLNIVSALTTARGPLNGWLKIVDYLYASRICDPKGSSPITYDQLLAARKKTAEGAALPAGVSDSSKLSTIIRAANQEVAAQHLVLEQSLEAVRGIDQFLTRTLGGNKTISFEVLETTLQDMLGAIKPFLTDAATAPGLAVSSGGTAEESHVAKSPENPIRGSIRSRTDVLAAIDNICDYYQQVEPSSPVPFLLRRAQKLAKMDFIQAVHELNLATSDTLRPSMGSVIDTNTSPA
jgi:type VI secretion system protein ImpA